MQFVHSPQCETFVRRPPSRKFEPKNSLPKAGLDLDIAKQASRRKKNGVSDPSSPRVLPLPPARDLADSPDRHPRREHQLAGPAVPVRPPQASRARAAAAATARRRHPAGGRRGRQGPPRELHEGLCVLEGRRRETGTFEGAFPGGGFYSSKTWAMRFFLTVEFTLCAHTYVK